MIAPILTAPILLPGAFKADSTTLLRHLAGSVLRRVDHFESKRLGRTFSPLFFGIIRKDHT